MRQVLETDQNMFANLKLFVLRKFDENLMRNIVLFCYDSNLKVICFRKKTHTVLFCY